MKQAMSQISQRQLSTGDATIAPRTWEVVATAGLVLAYELSIGVFGDESADVMNLLGPTILASILLSSAWRMVQRSPDQIWTALWWFRISTSIYFCGGSVVPLLASYTVRTNLQSLYAFQSAEILKLNLLVAYSTLIVLMTSLVVQNFIARKQTSRTLAGRSAAFVNTSTLRVGIVFLVIGGAIRYFIVLPNELGWTNLVLPGTLITLGNSILVALYLLTLWSLKRAPYLFPAVAGLIIFEMMTGLLLFNKAAVLLPLIVFALAWIQDGVTKRKVLTIVAMFGFSFAVLQPWVADARLKQAYLFGSTTGGTLADRAQILGSYFDDIGMATNSTFSESSLGRFSYVNVATFVINRYDRGLPGKSLDAALPLLIPRFLWPDKPLSTPGGDLAFLAAGQIGNSISAGLFAESYWCYGWWGLLLMIVPYAVVLSLVSNYALRVIQRGEWIYFPALFLALKMGVRVDGLYVNDVIGASAIFLGLHFVCFAIGITFGFAAPVTHRTRRA